MESTKNPTGEDKQSPRGGNWKLPGETIGIYRRETIRLSEEERESTRTRKWNLPEEDKKFTKGRQPVYERKE